MAIVNQLQRHAARVTVDIDGAALSAASVVAMAGDEIRMAENALLMIHDPIGLTIGTAADHAKAVVELEKVKDVIVATYAARSGMDEERAARLMADETWLTAEEALEEGLVDKVTEAKRMAAFGGSAAELLLGSYRHKPADLGVATDEDDAEAAAAEAGDGGEQETVVMSTKPKEQAAAPAGPEQPAGRNGRRAAGEVPPGNGRTARAVAGREPDSRSGAGPLDQARHRRARGPRAGDREAAGRKQGAGRSDLRPDGQAGGRVGHRRSGRAQPGAQEQRFGDDARGLEGGVRAEPRAAEGVRQGRGVHRVPKSRSERAGPDPQRGR